MLISVSIFTLYDHSLLRLIRPENHELEKY